MRALPNERIEQWRAVHPTLGSGEPGSDYGYFEVCRGAFVLRVISSGADPVSGWEHVSVSLPNRIPFWAEMQFVKELFWGDDETVLQFHPRRAQYVNHHPNVLHLWKRIGVEHELPPQHCV